MKAISSQAVYPDLRGQTVLITGGASGIGAELVRAFAEQGAAVHFCDVNSKAAHALIKSLSSRSLDSKHPSDPDVHFTKVDLRQERDIVRWTGRIKGPIKALINNAAVDTRLELKKLSVAQWDAILNLNLRSFFITAREIAPRLIAGSSIINLGSITFHVGFTNLTAYMASKGGIVGLTRSLARDLGPRGIRVNTLTPGWVMTERQLRDEVTPQTKKFIKTVQCLPDLIPPNEIATVALFLASNASRAITGQEILADKGWGLH